MFPFSLYFLTFALSTGSLMKKAGFWHRVFDLYYDGFRHMTLGKVLWAVILIKLFIIFFILKVFFFPNFLRQHAQEGKEGDFVAQELIDRKAPSTTSEGE